MAEPELRTHRTVFVVRVRWLDAHTSEEVDRAFERYLARVDEPSRLPVDFGTVAYTSSFIGVILYAANEGFGHRVACMRLSPNVRLVLDLLDIWSLPQFEAVPDGVCPACAAPGFVYETYSCAACGDLATFTVEIDG